MPCLDLGRIRSLRDPEKVRAFRLTVTVLGDSGSRDGSPARVAGVEFLPPLDDDSCLVEPETLGALVATMTGFALPPEPRLPEL